jgi:cephalosporin-C deacetylase
MQLRPRQNLPVVLLLLTVLLSSASCAANAPATRKPSPIKVSVDRTNATYQQGETVTFVVKLAPASNLPPDTEVSWHISKDGVPPLHEGKIRMTDGTATFTGKLDEPGHLLCRVSGIHDGFRFEGLAGAAIDPLKIKPSMPVPDDFDSFWAIQKKQLATVPLNPRLTPVENPQAADVECFDVRVDCSGKAPVSGYYARPKGAKPKSLPIILLLHGAGVRSSDLASAAGWAQNRMLAMDINAHGIDNGQPATYYSELQRGALRNYRYEGRESREMSYFVGMFLRAVRAVDFLTAQPEWDGKTVIAYGSSQGGFQAFAVAALDDRISFFSAGVPAGCDHTGSVANRINGWPKLVPTGLDGKPDEDVLRASRYIDNVNFAARTKAKGAHVTVGFIDLTCPPTSVYAAYNALPISKEIYNDIPSGHTNSPAATEARKQSVFRFLKSVK